MGTQNAPQKKSKRNHRKPDKMRLLFLRGVAFGARNERQFRVNILEIIAFHGTKGFAYFKTDLGKTCGQML